MTRISHQRSYSSDHEDLPNLAEEYEAIKRIHLLEEDSEQLPLPASSSSSTSSSASFSATSPFSPFSPSPSSSSSPSSPSPSATFPGITSPSLRSSSPLPRDLQPVIFESHEPSDYAGAQQLRQRQLFQQTRKNHYALSRFDGTGPTELRRKQPALRREFSVLVL